jgi:hypothetical protein
MKHYLNLKNGLEWLDVLGPDVRFMRIQFLIDVATGPVTIYDASAKHGIALWQGVVLRLQLREAFATSHV